MASDGIMEADDLGPDELKSIRVGRGETQAEFAEYLNRNLDRSYNKTSICVWERGTEKIPQPVKVFLRTAAQAAAAQLANVPPPNGEAIVIAVANQKGGVGKTTTAVNLGYALAKAGHRTLLVDLDPQANATIHLGLDPFSLELDAGGVKPQKTLYYVLLKDIPLADIVVPLSEDVPYYGAPASISLAAADAELMSQVGNSQVLLEKFEPIRGDYDFIIIDCPPQLGLLTVNALSAANWVLIPTQTEVLSSMGIPLLMETIKKILKRSNPGLRVLGILPTMHDAQLSDARANLKDLRATYENKMRVFPPIARTTSYAQSVAAGRVTLEALPNALGVDRYVTLAAEIMKMVGVTREVTDAS